MSETPTKIPAIHDWHLREVLADLHLLVALEAGEVQCIGCKSLLTIDSVGGILVRAPGEFSLVCTNRHCLMGFEAQK